MSEPTLSSAYSDIRAECGWIGGFGRDSANWGTNETLHIDAAQKAALTQAYYPPNGHRWKFLRPIATFTTWRTISGTFSTGVYSSSTGLTTLTATTSVFYPSVPGHSYVDTSSSGTYTVDGYTSGTVVTLQGNASTETGAFTITGDDTYRAPDDFDSLIGRMMFASTSAQGRNPIEQVSVENLIWMRDNEATGIPRFVAVQPVVNLAGQQRWNFMFYPEPDSVYTLSYRYRINPNNLTSTATAHYGGVWFSQLLLASARSAMEFEVNHAHGPHHADFIERLNAAVLMDRDSQPQTMGYVGDPSMGERLRYSRYSGTVTRDY